eukprot:5527324-Amphidinium_carterae.1
MQEHAATLLPEVLSELMQWSAAATAIKSSSKSMNRLFFGILVAYGWKQDSGDGCSHAAQLQKLVVRSVARGSTFTEW